MHIDGNAIAIFAIIAWAIVRISRDKHGYTKRERNRGLNQEPGDDGAHLPSVRETELQRELEQMRDRIKVLERIATEERHSRQIASEIEALRDK